MLSALFASFHLEASWTRRFLSVQETVYHCWTRSRSVLCEVCPCLYEFCFKCWLWPWPKLGVCGIPPGVLSPCRNMASKIPPDVPSPCWNMVSRVPPGIQSSFWNTASRIFPGSRKNLQTAPHSNHWVEIWSEPVCTEAQVPSHIQALDNVRTNIWDNLYILCIFCHIYTSLCIPCFSCHPYELSLSLMNSVEGKHSIAMKRCDGRNSRWPATVCSQTGSRMTLFHVDFCFCLRQNLILWPMLA